MYMNIKAEQSRKNLTDEQMAKVLGVTRKTYSKKIHDGGWNDVQAKTLCQFFNVSFDYLFQNSNEVKE